MPSTAAQLSTLKKRERANPEPGLRTGSFLFLVFNQQIKRNRNKKEK
jgi:hypothetical protein